MSKEVDHHLSLKSLAERRKRLMHIKFMSMLDSSGH